MEGLSKEEMLEVQHYIKEEFEGLKAWIKNDLVCSTHCTTRMYEQEKIILNVEKRLEMHQNNHNVTIKHLGIGWNILQVLYPIMAAILTVAGVKFL